MSEKYVIIGDGVAGATAAETIRDRDDEAEIIVFTDESEALYNRIMLKNYMKGTLPKQYTRMHDESWYESREIGLKLDTRVDSVDIDESMVYAGGEGYSYDKLLMAAGGSPRRLPQDEGYENIHYMWTMGDASDVRESAESAETAVVVGGGLLGIDLAMAYAENDCETYYLIRGDNWWHRGLDSDGAEIVHRKMREKGIKVMTNTAVDKLESENGLVTGVVSVDGREFDCDAVAVAIGQVANSNMVDVDKNESDMIKTNRFLETSVDNVFAAGNMVEYYSPVFERRCVKGSWDHSEAMGRCAGMNLVGDETGFDFVNTYGVGHFDVQFLAIGDWTENAVQRKYSEDEYRRLFFDGDRMVGAVMIGFTKGQEKIKQLVKDKEKFEDKERLLEKSYWEN